MERRAVVSIKEFREFRHLRVEAVDRDGGANGRVEYSVAMWSPAREFFSVDPVTGELKMYQLDRIVHHIHSFFLQTGTKWCLEFYL